MCRPPRPGPGRACVAVLPLERLEHASPAAMGEAPGARPWQERRAELLTMAEECRVHGVAREIKQRLGRALSG